MRMLMTVTAALFAATAIASSASAGTIGCDQGNSMYSTALTSCRYWNDAAAVPAQESFAQAPIGNNFVQAPQVYDSAPYTDVPPSTHTGISGGAGN